MAMCAAPTHQQLPVTNDKYQAEHVWLQCNTSPLHSSSFIGLAEVNSNMILRLWHQQRGSNTIIMK